MSQHIVTFPVAFVGRKANRKASSVQEQTPNYIFKATKKKKKIQRLPRFNSYTSNKGTMTDSHWKNSEHQ